MSDPILKNPHRLSPERLHHLRPVLFVLLVVAIVASFRSVPDRQSSACVLGQTAEQADAPGGRRHYCWALVGNDGTHLTEEHAAGIAAKVFRLSWRNYMPREHAPSQEYLTRKRLELGQLREAGFSVILNLGFHDAPGWVHDNYPNSHYVNQFGESYQRSTIDSGDLNLVFNPTLRGLVTAYIRAVFAEFGTDFVAVRLGGGRYGELTYPPATYDTRQNSYWAFDRNAVAQSPVPNWIPGQPSPAGESARFLTWYLDSLVAFQNWQISVVRQSYHGPIMMLYPSWGIRPGQIEEAIAGNLDGRTSAEQHGEIQRGLDFERQIAALQDPQVVVTTTWLDADASADTGPDPRYWSPVKYLAHLSQQDPRKLQRFGENTGQGHIAEMELSVLQMERYDLLGMAWYREEELFSGQYATLADFQRIVLHLNAFGSSR